MIFGDVIKTMNDTKVFRCTREELAVNLLKAASIVDKTDKDLKTTVTKWIDRGIPKNICTYFPNEINEDELIKYIERWATDKTWKTLQKAFNDYNLRAEKDHSIVYCSTSVRENFCQSLAVQLIESLGFPLPEKFNHINSDTKPIESEPERMLDLCHQSFNDFPIKDFIESNPAYSIKSYLIEDTFTVVKRIRQKHVNGDSPDRHSELYQNIMSFADALLDYLKFLKSSSGNLNILDEGYKPLNGDDNEFVEETNRYRQRLKSLYQNINIEIEKEEVEYHEQQRAAHNEAWEKNTQVGLL